MPLSLFKEKVSVIIRKPKGSIKVLNGSKPTYDLFVKAKAILVQNEENMSVNKIQKELALKIKSEIVKTINKSDEIHADLLNLSEKPYRYKHSKWDIQSLNSMDKSLIKDIIVKIKIVENASYKK
ncbi:Ger(x)C family spore germination C-terminal domain-containing protein [Neobacillus pocheonensis]|uniref:Ger(X)C family spore germination C-terminal domain-containing protein n=1 Tax=Neobacillus pocheonensis TaxID=363869 RepID=A0ABT0WHM3_9BACI|nr:Ger(x)C family spore germination C-terminal domain-containing protein [Neobacillus pocheonensis]